MEQSNRRCPQRPCRHRLRCLKRHLCYNIFMKIRKSSERGRFDYGWLNTQHTFSFGDYQDPANTHFRSLRVINEDYVQAGMGFPTHAHRDMEIVTFIIAGELEHKDSLGNGSVIRPGDVQRMSAGTGVTHSEFNPSAKNPTHLLQLWIFPEKNNLKPSYEQKNFSSQMKKEGLVLLASGDPQGGAVKIHQDAGIYHGLLKAKGKMVYEAKVGRGIWIQMISGKVDISKNTLEPGDGAALEKETKIEIAAPDEECRFLLFDLQ